MKSKTGGNRGALYIFRKILIAIYEIKIRVRVESEKCKVKGPGYLCGSRKLALEYLST